MPGRQRGANVLSSVTTTQVVDDAGLARILVPRSDVVAEAPPVDGTYALEHGPFTHYERVVTVAPLADGSHEVTQATTYKLAVPIWGFLFARVVRREFKRNRPGHVPWWLPPDRLDARASEMLSLLCVFSVIAGYLGVLLSQTNTFFKEEFGSSNSDISNVLIGARVGGLLALVLLAMADRRGRRWVLLVSTYAGILMTATGALAPDLWTLGISQTIARAFSAAMFLVLAVMAVEEMPAGGRAFAVSVLTMSGALGAGGVVGFLWVGDVSPGAWRAFYVIPLLFLWPVVRISRRVLETRRFEVHEAVEGHVADGTTTAAAVPAGRASEHRRRFAMLGTTSFLFAIFSTPASGFFNEYFRTERDFSGGRISLLQILTNLPGGISIVVGGQLAERFGRRLVGSVGVVGGVGFTVAMYLGTGWPVWLFSALATIFGAMTIPALGVYGPELFATGDRGRTNGWLNILGVAGSIVGLLVAGWLADRFGSFGPTMAILAIGPALVVLVIILFYPETAHTELEELNPEDAPLPPGDGALPYPD